MIRLISNFIFAIVFIFLILLTSTPMFAQTGWNIVRRTASEDLVSVFFVNSEKGFVGGDNGYLALTTDSGKNWTKQNLASTSTVNEVYFRDEKNGYVLIGDKLFSTLNGGSNWQEIKNFGLTSEGSPDYYAIRFVSKKIGFIVGSLTQASKINSLILKTEDGGQTWKKLSIPFQAELFSLDFIDEKKGWVVGDKGAIFVTDNGGQTWKSQTSETNEEIYCVDFRNALEGYAVGGKGLILRTENGGNTWIKVKTSYPNTFLRINFIDEKTGWIVGRSGTILRSDDKGKNWIKQDSKTTDSLFGFYMEKKTGWAVGGKGIVLKYQK